ncbi:protein phosphatase 2C domain-containing protein [Kitasatospora sp. NBC_01287]|uniref:protein phosphatase 2C domain-containing protein n=1 Tax=Kitasatospora sp. NBC_01287 TaxID=2903573 RepID=UPI00224DB0A9|nr:protein phosphatase 2C domain-containing protein [Kitasatospora sp. NBC_01287]MCX4746214.1 protein phosphatase 2C domain-containing protein [Kitasatospora sp. NBC_01287]
MKATFATRPALPDRPNEDLAILGPGLAILLDGAGGPSEDGGGCVHGVRWYVRELGAQLLAGLLDARQRPPATVLAEAIEAVARLHAPTCDLADPGTPSSTVAIVVQREDRFDHLALHDSTIVLALAEGPHVVSDRRVQQIPELQPLWQAMTHHQLGTPEHAAARRAYMAVERHHRNTPTGYWVAGADPRSAAEAVTGTLPAAQVRSVSLFSDGVADYVDAYRQATWPQVLDLLDEQGPTPLIDRVRSAEQHDPQGRRWPRFKLHDDATAVHWIPAQP